MTSETTSVPVLVAASPLSPVLGGEGRGEGPSYCPAYPPGRLRNFLLRRRPRKSPSPRPSPPSTGERGTASALAAVERTTRLALGVVWVYEGLVPKILFRTEVELDLVERSGVYWPTPAAMLVFTGVCEILGGLWLLSGRASRVAAALSVVLLLVVGTACAVLEPGILYHPFGGLSKNLGLLACAAVVYRLAPFKCSAPKPRPHPFTTTKEVS